MRFIPKNFRRRCWKGLAILFALIAVLDVGLWVRGQFAGDWILLMFRRDTRDATFLQTLIFANNRNSLWIEIDKSAYDGSGQFYQHISGARSETEFQGVSRILGICGGGHDPWRSLIDPGPIIAHRTIVIVSLAAFALFARLGWKKRFAPGLCQKCGYDLRATPDRCPECGVMPQRIC